MCRYAHGPGTEALFKWAPRSWSEISLQSAAVRRRPRRPRRGARRDAALPADVRGIAHRRHGRSITPCPATSPTSTGGCSAASASRPRPSSSIRRGSSRRSTSRTPIRSPGWRTAARSIVSSRAASSARRGRAARVSLIVLDLDRLKEINDTYGHEAGDRALRAVGAVLGSTVRENDLCARFAGDEFVVLLWDSTPEQRSAPRPRAAERGGGLPVRTAAGRAASRSRSAPVRRDSRSTAARSKNCWPRPTSACITTRPAGARATPAGTPRSSRKGRNAQTTADTYLLQLSAISFQHS